MRTRTLGELAELLTAAGSAVEVVGDPGARVGPDVVIDSRLVAPGALFIALPGERTDGHDFLAAARAAGASAALTARRVDDPLPQLVVDDAQAGLIELARAWHAEAREHGLITVAITGSAGKTSTKDLLAQVLAAAGPTISPVGSFNNELGTPLTVGQLASETRYLVSEMGARASGDIAYLCSIVRPDIGMVLNVGTAHLGEFGSQEGIAQAKGELVEALDEHGWAVLNADDPLVDQMASRTQAQLARFTFGTEPLAADLVVRVSDLVADDLERHSFTLGVERAAQTEQAAVRLRLIGRHQVANAAAAAAAALAAGLDLPTIATALSAATPRSPMRMALHELPSGAALINDAYNANPESMAAALGAVGAIGARRRQRYPQARVIAILGDMLELGPEAPERHQWVGEQAAAAGVDRVLAIGDFAPFLVAGAIAGGAGAEVADVQSAAGSLELGPGDIVLVKASRGLRLEQVADQLVGGKVVP